MDVYRRRSSIHQSIRRLVLVSGGDDNVDDDDVDDNERLEVYFTDGDGIISSNLTIAQSILSDIREGTALSIASTVLGLEQLDKHSNKSMDVDKDSKDLTTQPRGGSGGIPSVNSLGFDRNKIEQEKPSLPTINIEIIKKNNHVNQKTLDYATSKIFASIDKHNLTREVEAHQNISGHHLSYKELPTKKIQQNQDALNYQRQFDQQIVQRLQQQKKELLYTISQEQQDGNDPIDVIDNEDPYGFLDMNMFLTTKDGVDKLGPGHPFVQLGRPDLVDGFKNIRAEVIQLGEKRVAVCVCAAERIINTCKKACIEY